MNKRTGQTIQKLAEILFYISIIAVIILGGSYWYLLSRMMRGGLGFLVCIMIIGVGVFGAYVYKVLMMGFGEIVEHQDEHTDLLKKMILLMQNNAGHQTPGMPQAAQAVRAETGSPAVTPPNEQVSAHPPESPQTAEFESRSASTVACPVCGKEQMSNRNFCYSCGCRFIYRNEQPR